jgi:hypothetical protein
MKNTTILACLALVHVGWVAVCPAEEITYNFRFDKPMSWADDVVYWGLGGTQKWEIAKDANASPMLRIAGKDHGLEATWEMRTLQVNHKPGARAIIRFDIRGAEVFEQTNLMVRYFDGYCTGNALKEIADEPFAPFPPPLFDANASKVAGEWKHVELDTGPLKNTVLTVAFAVRQYPNRDTAALKRFVEYHLRNLSITTETLDRFMDAGLDWHGATLGVQHLRSSTAGAHLDWCDFADQEDVKTADGKVIHFTLLQFRDTSTYRGAMVKHNTMHETCGAGVGGASVITLNRESSGGANAVSWGIRQTFAYSGLGLKPGEPAKISVSMKMGTMESANRGASKVQLGIDPRGGICTQEATWSPEFGGSYFKEGWHVAKLEFDRPPDATACTIYFRHRDGLPTEPRFPSNLPEPQSAGSELSSTAFADWVLVKVVK